MKIRAISERQWKVVLCIAILFFSAIWVSAAANWQQVLKPGVSADRNFTVDLRSGHVARVNGVASGSRPAALGLKEGDMVTFDDIGDAWRVFYAAEQPIGMTIGEGSARRHVVLRAEAVAHIDTALATFYVLFMANALVALLLAALLGLRRASSPSARMLVLVLLVEPSLARQFLPGGALAVFAGSVISNFVIVAAYCGFFLFSCWFPDDEPVHVRPWVRRLGHVLTSCFIALALFGIAYGCGWVGRVPVLNAVQTIMISLIVMLSSINLFQAYRNTSGISRQRVQWVGLSIGIRFVCQVLLVLPGLAFLHTQIFSDLQVVLTALANIGLAYGILRHRVLDVGFAVNRALVYGIVSAVMLVSFGLLEWLAHHFISGDESEKNVLLDGAIALGLYLGFHRLKHSVDHIVEKLFFHHWHQNEEQLRRFVRQAAHVTSPEDLAQATLAALQRFSGEAGCALYRLGDGGRYRCAASAGMPAPLQAGANDPLAVTLRAEMAPAAPGDAGSALPGALALPMGFRGELQGFVLLGQKPSQAAYRPDEVAVLEHAVQQVGLDLQALRTEQLQARVAGLEQELSAYARAFELNRMAG